MKKFLLALAALCAATPAALAQNIALDERAPEPRIQSWLDDREPAPAPLTYIEFFHSSNKSSQASLDRLQELSAEYGDRLRIIVVVHEPREKVAQLLAPRISDRLGVGFDPAGRNFAAYGVTYVPFGVLLGPRNRALWMGNTLQLTPEIIDRTK